MNIILMEKISFTYYAKPSSKILPSKFSPYPYSNKIRIQNKTYKKQKIKSQNIKLTD